ncbi:hypothetical protein AVEN_142603-1 [Araneus ventricosus]|uniref:Uncharacterized protein n=1 Tax=Araneus ventricosus TaxID=182803 RepID=A0A4Y2GBV6_ARAVE|nr:hypothetical protein AVEN_142603-1 [Araneus ventricosus]
MTEFADQRGPSGPSEGPDRSWRAEIEPEEEDEDVDKVSVLSGQSSSQCSHGSSAYSCSTSGSSRTCSSSVGSGTSGSSSSCSCSVSDSSEFDPRAHLPYPTYVPISWYCLEQTTPPRNWCLWLISNPYPFDKSCCLFLGDLRYFRNVCP